MAIGAAHPPPAASRGQFLDYLFLGAVLVQSLHMLEHVVQAVQIQAFGVPWREANGLLGSALVQEWVHLAYGGPFLLVMITLLLGYSLLRGRSWLATRPLLYYAFVGVVLFDGYHETEHLVKIRQFLETGVENTPGLLGQFVNVIWLHFFFNSVVYTALLVVFLGYGIPRRIGARIKKLGAQGLRTKAG